MFQNTIELRGVPFLWLPDLSAKDPFYILPVLLAISMFLMQWISLRSIDTDNPQITANTGTKLVSISRCPGDFRPAEDPDCVQRLGPVSNLRWGFEDAPFRCRIERDQRYYFNVLFTGDETLPAEWACNAAPGDDPEDCAMLFNTLSE